MMRLRALERFAEAFLAVANYTGALVAALASVNAEPYRGRPTGW